MHTAMLRSSFPLCRSKRPIGGDDCTLRLLSKYAPDLHSSSLTSSQPVEYLTCRRVSPFPEHRKEFIFSAWQPRNISFLRFPDGRDGKTSVCCSKFSNIRNRSRSARPRQVLRLKCATLGVLCPFRLNLFFMYILRLFVSIFCSLFAFVVSVSPSILRVVRFSIGGGADTFLHRMQQQPGSPRSGSWRFPTAGSIRMAYSGRFLGFQEIRRHGLVREMARAFL